MFDDLFALLIFLTYPLAAIFFVIVTKKCFVKKLTVPKAIGLFLLSPCVSYIIPYFIVFVLFFDKIDYGLENIIKYVATNTIVQLLIQILFVVIYLKIVKANNSSIAMFVYLCSSIIIPDFTYLLNTTNKIPLICYWILHIAFFKMVIIPLSDITNEKKVTNAGLFVILPLLTFIYNTVLGAFYWCFLFVVNLNDDSAKIISSIIKDEKNEFHEQLKLIFVMFSKAYNFIGDMTIYSCIFIAIVLIIAFYVIVRNIKYMNEMLSAQQEVKTLSVEVMEALAHTIDAKDEYTRGHSIRVAKYSRMIAEKMGMSETECENVYYMGLLHDIGKIGVPNEIINKPDRLTDEEYDEIKKHPVTGYDILAEIKSRPDLATGARWHHERYDGKGYPDHKTGDEIPIEARIIAVADSYDAMTSNRSYRDYLPQEVVREEILKNINTQFDEEPARCMIAIIDEDKEYVLHE